jgi:DNA-binding PadR family transcriptional regulator
MKGEHLGELEELVLLCLQAVDGDAATVDIQQMLEEAADRALSLGAIYAALDRLTGKGFVRSDLGEPTPVPGGRRKRLYTVTPDGAAALVAKREIRRSLWRRAHGPAPEGGGA